MTDDGDIHPLDATLVALLDGALTPEDAERTRRRIAADPSLAARLERLAAGGGIAREAFATLPPPPPELAAWLERQTAEPATVVDLPRRPARSGAPMLRIAAAMAAVLIAGIAIGHVAGRLVAPESGIEDELAESPEEWREAVASYLTLYIPETLADLPDDPALHERQLALLANHLGVPLSASTVAIPDLTFKRAQLFDYEGKPLGQIAYTDPSGEPVALCILDEALPDEALKTEKRHGIAIAYWSKGGRGYLLAGRLPPDRLEAMAADVARRLSG